jgi:hypothetical protein
MCMLAVAQNIHEPGTPVGSAVLRCAGCNPVIHPSVKPGIQLPKIMDNSLDLWRGAPASN